MKSIEVTYDVSVRDSEVWEPGEAAFRLDFVDDDIAALLQKLVDIPVDRMNNYEHFIWNKFNKFIDNMEWLRNRIYFNNSIKSIKVIGGDN